MTNETQYERDIFILQSLLFSIANRIGKKTTPLLKLNHKIQGHLASQYMRVFAQQMYFQFVSNNTGVVYSF